MGLPAEGKKLKAKKNRKPRQQQLPHQPQQPHMQMPGAHHGPGYPAMFAAPPPPHFMYHPGMHHPHAGTMGHPPPMYPSMPYAWPSGGYPPSMMMGAYAGAPPHMPSGSYGYPPAASHAPGHSTGTDPHETPSAPGPQGPWYPPSSQ